MRAFVTGGAGFIGSTLVDRLLAEGHAVDVMDDLSSGRLANLADARADRSAELRIHQGDLRNPEVVELIARREPEVIFHLAASAPDDPAADVAANLVPALHVLEGARLGGATKVVFASDASIYGEPDPAELPVRESHPHEPVTVHAVAKKVVVDYLRLYRERHGIEFTALALASVYGPRQERGLIAGFARAVVHGEAPVLHGDGSQTRDFVYVDDVVDAFVRAASRGSGLLVNIASGVEVSVRDVLTVVAAASGSPVVPASGSRPELDIDRLALDPGRARIHLGWSPWTTLEEGVAQVLRWTAAQRT